MIRSRHGGHQGGDRSVPGEVMYMEHNELLVERLATIWDTPESGEMASDQAGGTDPPGTWRSDTEDRDA